MAIEQSRNEIEKNWKQLKNVIEYINYYKETEPSLPIVLKSPPLILESIEKWRQYDFRNKAIADILEEVENFLHSIGTFACSKTTKIHPYTLWRIRKWKGELLKDENEFWAPKFSKLSRCNIDRETILYTSIDKKTPLDECRITDGDKIYLIEYETLDTLELIYPYANKFHPTYKEKEIYSKESLVSYQVLREFLRSEFTKPVGEGTEYLYKISAAFSKKILSNKKVDGIIYSSIQSPNEFNIAILEKAFRKLKIKNIYASTITADQEEIVKYKGNVNQDKVDWIKQV